ncbi:hypothetical protein ACFL5Y_02065 [Candidatus Omnitrophota bacterium]
MSIKKIMVREVLVFLGCAAVCITFGICLAFIGGYFSEKLMMIGFFIFIFGTFILYAAYLIVRLIIRIMQKMRATHVKPL